MKNLDLEQIANFLGYSSLYLKVILSFVTSFLVAFVAIPKVIRVAYRKQLMDVPGDRSSHTNKVPSLGGVAIYFAIVIVTSIFSADMLRSEEHTSELQSRGHLVCRLLLEKK